MVSMRCCALLLFIITACSQPEPQPQRVAQGRASASPAIDVEGDFPIQNLVVTAAQEMDPRYTGRTTQTPELYAAGKRLMVVGHGPKPAVLAGTQWQSLEMETQDPVLGWAMFGDVVAALHSGGVILTDAAGVTKSIEVPKIAISSSTFPIRFDGTDTHLLIPNAHGGGVLITLEGTQTKVARDDWQPEETDLPRTAHWRHLNGMWLAAYTHHPRLVLYDPELNQIEALNFHVPAVDAYTLHREKLRERGRESTQRPLFSNLEVKDGHAFLLHQGWLHRIDPSSGVVSVFRLIAPDHPKFHTLKRLKLNGAALLGDQWIFTGGPVGSRLFAATLPPE